MYQGTYYSTAPAIYSANGAPPIYTGAGYVQPVIIAQPGYIRTRPLLSSYPQPFNCPNCKTQIVTRTEAENGCFSWLMVGILCFLGLWCGCQFIPLCIDSFKDVHHYCPNCNQFLGVRSMM